MTVEVRPFPPSVGEQRGEPPTALDILGTTDHKSIGLMYLVTSFGFFLFAGILAMLMRGELARPGLQIVSNERYNQFFTIHGTVMMLLFATPLFSAFANYLVPLQIGAPDIAFPRLNALGYWLYLVGGLIVVSGFLTRGGAADFGWFAYSPLTSAQYSPHLGGDLWAVGLVMSGLSTVLASVNFITTIITLRAPGMLLFRMPIFTWNVLITSVLALLAFPVLTAALLALEADRRFGAHVYDASNGGAILWQHLFWFFGHPEVYIVALPFFGIVTEILPVFSRKPIFGYRGLVFATVGIGALSMAVWAHHMFVTGAVLLPFFAFLSFLIAVPTGMKFFNWIGTMWRGTIILNTPMLFSIGFLITFLFGGLTGVTLASPPIDFHVTDSYYVVGHLHYVLFGTIVFSAFAGVYFWFPKVTGRFLNEKLGKLHFWSLLVGFHVTFLPMHWLGVRGMPRRVADYLPTDGFTTLNTIESAGSFLLGLSTLPFLYNVWRSLRHGDPATSGDAWGYGNSLEWATSCPPPKHNFHQIPRIRSERPAFDLNHPRQGPEGREGRQRQPRRVDQRHRRELASVEGETASRRDTAVDPDAAG
ncbi:heme/copper-type cytochrome/quinol oxidase, subunit 1 [Frankia sp. CcI6]|uniref:aa3-type cytochrome oxidase subunit I n=1 Tax=Frankia sp. CcI6 TaxID=1352929 RepID=UPI0003CFA958|nr:cytochrome c oxidase subunit I [Frankia sp. CcI6]ETA00740.1 heme/copper-type cytochrome/quinol oxidase, subunit 1 [Frankia sp. CcI6]